VALFIFIFSIVFIWAAFGAIFISMAMADGEIEAIKKEVANNRLYVNLLSILISSLVESAL